jgi:glutamate-1-semialdehyde aminotransferase
VLGYRDQDVDNAIRRQLDRGISFSLATELEAELAEIMCQLIPCADMVKFGKSGTDVTTAAVRLARAITGKDHILMSGYHGWQDWSMACTDRNVGIPQATGILTHRFTYGNKDEVCTLVSQLNGEVAAIIVEANDDPFYLRWLREFATLHGIILIFDEVITGFRYDLGGAQRLYGVTPDLATFGKAMANGMPISALCGRREYMKRCAPPNNIFYSGTMFGETLSIAAAIACITKLKTHNVIPHLWQTGQTIMNRVTNHIYDKRLSDVVSITGKAPRSILTFKEYREASADEVRTLFMIEMARHGCLIINSNNISYSMGRDEVKRIEAAYAAALHSIWEGDIKAKIGGAVVQAKPLRETPWFS